MPSANQGSFGKPVMFILICARVLAASLLWVLLGCTGPATLTEVKPTLPEQQIFRNSDSYEARPITSHLRGSIPNASSPFAGQSELVLADLVEAVLVRNPTLIEMQAAWQAASARYLQVTSFDDPMLRIAVGPGSIGSDTVDFAYRLELSQRLPFPGKLSLRGEQANREAIASAYDYQDAKLALIEATKSAYYDYYLAHRALEVNQENVKLLEEASRTVEARVRTGVAPQQDLLQLQVELGQLQERRIILQRVLTLASARINTLLHLPPDTPLPLPPRQLTLQNRLPELSHLQTLALQNRPDLLALRQRVQAERAALDLAYREYLPDFEIMAAYDSFWQERPLRTMLGVGVNLPIQLDRRRAAVTESAARLAQRQAQLDRLADQVRLQIQDSYTRVLENRQIVELYDKKLLPAAQANIREAMTAYSTGKIPLLTLLEAQRHLINLRDRYYEAVVDYYRNLAALERAVGVPLPADDHKRPDK